MSNTVQSKKYHVITYGCQMNKSDSERIASIFEQYNCSPVGSPEEADFIIMNTCSIRKSAEDRVHGQAHNFQKLKELNPDLKVAVTGCMANRSDAAGKAKVDAVVTIKDLALLPEKLGLKKPENLKVVEDYFGIAPKHSNKFQAFVPIMTGCNNFCTFCVVPFTRGREYSRPLADILNEVEQAVANGAKEIMLLGQNVNSYKYGFVDLLKRLNALPGDFWIRFVSSNPQDMNFDLIDTIAEGEKLAKWIHFAVQSGNDRVLKRMNRRHTMARYLELYDYMKAKMPAAGISTDVIVGFPSETEEEFNDTVRLFERAKFDMAYISQYSARSGTPSFRMNDDITHAEKERREAVLNEMLGKTAMDNSQQLIGQTIRVLIEKVNKRGFLSGKETGYRTVVVMNSADESLVGRFVNVMIERVREFGLEGTLVPTAGLTPLSV